MCKLVTRLLSKKCKLFSGRDMLSICEVLLLFSNHPNLFANEKGSKRISSETLVIKSGWPDSN
jgi:hypothetical protein